MGEVYRAQDTRLGREVALKILPEDVANDPVRLQRLRDEARAVAALNHPNIMALYDVGENYLIAELVEGETLRTAKIGHRKVADIGVQIASGLGAAHEAGIVHRDLKPENILLTRDGRVKILDFGLARMVAPRGRGADTSTVTLHTEPGVRAGTPAMSPEQVLGASVDHRSDIFNVGLILHELWAGKRPFHGDSAVETMTAILKQEAPELPESVPAVQRSIVARCLEKEPPNRFQSAKDLAFALESAAVGRSEGPRLTRRTVPQWAVILLVVSALAAAAAIPWLWRPRPQSWRGMRLGGPEVAWRPRLSPDGRTVAMLTLVGNQSQVAVMRPDAGDWSVLTRDEGLGAAIVVRWSPDGSRIFYDRIWEAPRGVYSVPVIGGAPRLVVENAAYPECLADGSLLVTRFNARGEARLNRYWPETGQMQEFPFEVLYVNGHPFRALPGGRAVAVLGSPVPAPPGHTGTGLYRLDLASGTLSRWSQETGGFEGQTLALALTCPQ